MVRVIKKTCEGKVIGEVTNCASVGQHKRSSLDIINDSDIIDADCCEYDDEGRETLLEEDPQDTDKEDEGEIDDSGIVDADEEHAENPESEQETEDEIDDSDIVDVSSDDEPNPNMERPTSPMKKMNTGNKSISI